jgi:putative transposase
MKSIIVPRLVPAVAGQPAPRSHLRREKLHLPSLPPWDESHGYVYQALRAIKPMSYWKLYYHFIWGTKNRSPIIDSNLEPELYRAIAAKVRDMEGLLHAIGRIEDHVHLAVSIPPKIAPAKFIGDVKGNSSHFVNYVIKPDFEFHWQDEYGVLSFGEKNLSAVVRYIQYQKQHHANGTLNKLMEQCNE